MDLIEMDHLWMVHVAIQCIQTTLVNGTGENQTSEDDQQCLYFVGNSLGAQPRAVREYVNAQFETWASIGVKGHDTKISNSPLTPWQDLAEDCAKKSADLVGSSPHEIVIMNTLTINLHLLMASFYKPDAKRFKIILEWRPFPSDYYAIESQIAWHGLDPATCMIKIEPDNPKGSLISTELILKTIDENAHDTALLLLPGIQYYSGQLFDIPKITAHAKANGIIVGWDLAHAAGNVELKLHDWNVDFACWCTYKYINAGPGAIAGAFIHERYGTVDLTGDKASYRPRLTGWYGGDKSVRFNMDNKFIPTPGAAGYQTSNPSAIDLASLSGALSVFGKTCMKELRDKALVLTAYAEYLLDEIINQAQDDGRGPLFSIISPRDPLQRGTQLSVLLREGLLESASQVLEESGVLCDKRKPGVIRVAPVPLYTRFEDVWRFMRIFRKALGLEMAA
ncbi:kynureninase [Pochonia chlamydosporia 170]|uniref:Kynureninase n=1 Tax=Pochonia chlamydosporia 170 TaxID=1380566 RepID=A0A179F1K5_METCM|nr:kynureninase [Pochonia chlamydosporia 170]OAQ59335.1 kynureninase [Pochonia chlamydosporia 170]